LPEIIKGFASMLSGLDLLVAGVLLIYGVRRASHWMHRRGWIRWKMRRGTSSGLGNAMLDVQSIFQPGVRDQLEVRIEEHAEEGKPGDPPEPGSRTRVTR
jgi:hypothetical protein